MFALGLMSWLYGRSVETTVGCLQDKFGTKRPEIAAANIKALQAGYAFGETTESFAVTYEVKPAEMAPGVYRRITGNPALSHGLTAASPAPGGYRHTPATAALCWGGCPAPQRRARPLFLGAPPTAPASAVLEEPAG